MERVEVTYHREDGSWWAESDEMPGFSALADTFATVRAMVRAEFASRFDGGTVLLEKQESGALFAESMQQWLRTNIVAPTYQVFAPVTHGGVADHGARQSVVMGTSQPVPV